MILRASPDRSGKRMVVLPAAMVQVGRGSSGRGPRCGRCRWWPGAHGGPTPRSAVTDLAVGLEIGHAEAAVDALAALALVKLQLENVPPPPLSFQGSRSMSR